MPEIGNQKVKQQRYKKQKKHNTWVYWFSGIMSSLAIGSFAD